MAAARPRDAGNRGDRVTVVLTIGAALLIRSFARLQNVSPGFDAAHALAADIPLSGTKYGNDEMRTAVVDRLIERLAPFVACAGPR
ncbi:MAG TPA: hypothetical protein VNC21_02480 [Vicinamibacterales bacterium]|jgi:hypothetical protein|nr:hypothetical protein [Vicinamibacterales bacterium]